MKVQKFEGFTPATIQFLQDLGENNYKEWFEAHRDVYEKELVLPFKALITALTPAMYAIDTRFEFRPHRVLSRIYRDTRFSHNKDPYKNRLWMTFQRPVPDWENYPGFFMELSSEGYQYGMGLYAAKKQIMEDFRERVTFNAEYFKSITKELTGKRKFQVEGELYKRPLKNDLEDYFQDWMQRKTVWIWKSYPIGEEVFNEKILRKLEDDFTAMKNLYNFFLDE